MKIFVYNKEVFQNKIPNTYSSSILVGDKNQIYHYSINRSSSDKFTSTINSIRRALVFVRNNKPLYCNNNIEVFTNINDYIENLNLENRILIDNYINMFRRERNQDINLNNKIKSDIDIEHINFTKTLVDIEIRNSYVKNLYNSKDRF